MEKGLAKDGQFALHDAEDKEEALSKISAMFHELFEDALVNYVVPGALPSTTHSDDAVLMRFRAFT